MGQRPVRSSCPAQCTGRREITPKQLFPRGLVIWQMEHASVCFDSVQRPNLFKICSPIPKWDGTTSNFHHRARTATQTELENPGNRLLKNTPPCHRPCTAPLLSSFGTTSAPGTCTLRIMNVYRINLFHTLKQVILVVYKIEPWLLQKAAQKTSDPPGSLLQLGHVY